MKIKLQNLERKISSVVRIVGQLADKSCIPVYVVGGVVRDALLKRSNMDLDIILEGDVASFAKNFSKEYNAKITNYPQFQTATITLEDGFKFDIVTVRKESYAYSGALPKVTRGSLRDDLLRRDFTINAMVFSINKKSFGKIIDYAGGLKDLRAKKIRILHKKSFLDDPTRILRAVRFEQRFNFQIEVETFKLLKEVLKNNIDHNVKPQRYFEEFKKILSERKPKKCIQRLAALDGLRFLECDCVYGKNVGKIFDAIEKNIIWFKKEFPNKNLEEWLIYLMVLLHQTSFDKTKAAVERFNLRKEDREKILLAKTVRKIIEKISPESVTPYEIYKALKPLSNEAILFCRACKASPQMRQRIENYFKKYEDVCLAINGNELKRMGVDSGIRMGHILEEVLHRKINGEIKSHSEELKFAESLK